MARTELIRYETEGMYREVTSWKIYKELYKAHNILIAGTIGSGKSVLLNGIISTLITNETPASYKYYLIDPKRVELKPYKDLSDFCLGYTTTASGALRILKDVIAETERRYAILDKAGAKKWSEDLGEHQIVFIDELADLMISEYRKEILTAMQKILQIGRAAGIHIFAATQAPNRKVIPAEITLNFDNKIGLRCVSAIESRQIVQVAGCEKIHEFGKAIWLSPSGLEWMPVPYVDDEYIEARCNWWREHPYRVISC